MKRIMTLLLWILSITFPATGQDTLLLFHPTIANLEIFQNLVTRRILPLEDFHLIGVYHVSGNYDFETTRCYIERNGLDWVTLAAVSPQVEPGDLFGENGFTEMFRDLFRISRGALFMGGPDIPPQLYGEDVNLLTVVTDPARHYLEASFLFHLLGGTQGSGWVPFLEEKPGYLVSGICLGMQTLNVATGGTLVQDIPTGIYRIQTAEGVLELPEDMQHRNYRGMTSGDCSSPTSYHFHRIRFPEGSFLAGAMASGNNEESLVLSSHHQSVEKLGMGLRVAAVSMDGKIIEAIQHTRFPHVIGVQFHPENPGLFDPSISHPLSCTDSINFHSIIRNTPSYDFHLAYWKYIGKILE